MGERFLFLITADERSEHIPVISSFGFIERLEFAFFFVIVKQYLKSFELI